MDPRPAPVADQDRVPIGSGDRSRAEDNSVGRVLTLSDGVFAIAMTLLSLDLKIPDLSGRASDAQLRHALWVNADSYWSYLLTFYVIAGYWYRHRRLMRSMIDTNVRVLRLNMLLLLIIAAMPFPASLLGRYGGAPIALAIYGGANALATTTFILLSRSMRHPGLTDPRDGAGGTDEKWWNGWLNLVVFLLCIPAGYVLHSHGPFVLVLLAIPLVGTLGRRLHLDRLRLGRPAPKT